jgi:hypothetical protein
MIKHISNSINKPVGLDLRMLIQRKYIFHLHCGERWRNGFQTQFSKKSHFVVESRFLKYVFSYIHEGFMYQILNFVSHYHSHDKMY